MKNYFYPVIVQKEDVGYSAVVPDIDGCFTEGITQNELFENVLDAIGLCLEDYDVYPEPSKPFDITPQITNEQCVNIVKFNMLEYKKKHDKKAIKKTLTIPAWLNNEAMEHNINFSRVLQEALIDKLGLNSDKINI